MIIIALLILLSFCASCKEKNYEDRISQLRYDEYAYSGDSFKLSAFIEERENPFEEDGYKGITENHLIFRLSLPAGAALSESPEISFCLGEEEYAEKFTHKTAASNLYCDIVASSMPNEDFFVDLTINGEKINAEMTSVKRQDIISYSEAIRKSLSGSDSRVTAFKSDPENYELRVRLLESEGYNYWCVGIIGKKDKIFFLIDGDNGEIISIAE